ILFVQRRYRAVLITCGLTILAALAFLPVAWQYFSSHWARVVQIPTNINVLYPKFLSALGEPLSFTAFLWCAAGVLALIAAFLRQKNGALTLRVSLLLFAAVSIIGYYQFLRTLGYPTRSWYYLPLI